MTTQTNLEKLKAPLPPEAIKPHPTKTYLSSINSIFVTERLNEVFGIGGWSIKTEFIDRADVQTKSGVNQMIVVKVTLQTKDGAHYESFGGNDNADLGDAYKGATTDAITKIGSWLGIGADVWKNKQKQSAAPSSNVNDDLPWFSPQEKTHIEALGKARMKYEGADLVKAMRGVFKISKANAEIMKSNNAFFTEKDFV